MTGASSSSHASARASSVGPARLLLLTKTARWRLQERDEQHAQPDSAALPPAENHHRSRLNEAMRLACEAHESAVNSLVTAIGDAGFEVRSHDARDEIPPADFAWADACLALGGDASSSVEARREYNLTFCMIQPSYFAP